MGWIQLKDANWKIPYVGGLCEGFVEGAWGQATKPTTNNQITYGVYSSASAAWEAQPIKHTGRPPAGITVPVYFSLGSTNAGHVAIALSDGSVASSTQGGFHTQGYIHPNLDDLINIYAKFNNGCKYLGWGEYVGKVRVVQPTAPVKEEEKMTTTQETKYNVGVIYDSIQKLGEGNIIFQATINGDMWKLDTVNGQKPVSAAKFKKGDLFVCQYYVDIKYKGQTQRYYLSESDILARRLYGINGQDVKIVKEYK